MQISLSLYLYIKNEKFHRISLPCDVHTPPTSFSSRVIRSSLLLPRLAPNSFKALSQFPESKWLNSLSHSAALPLFFLYIYTQHSLNFPRRIPSTPAAPRPTSPLPLVYATRICIIVSHSRLARRKSIVPCNANGESHLIYARARSLFKSNFVVYIWPWSRM